MLALLKASRLFRFLLSLLIGLRRSVGRIAVAFQARFASLWSSTFARRSSQSQTIRLHPNDVPVVHNNPTGERAHISGRAKVEQEGDGTLAPPLVQDAARWHWQDLELPSCQAHRFDFYPATPETGSRRYAPERTSQNANPLKVIPAGQQKLLSALPPLPHGWRRYVHPEGNVLFYYEKLRIFTESDITIPQGHCQSQRESEILFCATDLIRKGLKIGDVIMDELTEIVVNVHGNECYYYFVDHRNRLLFWVDEVPPKELDTDLQGITEYSHIRYLVEARYWYASSDCLSGMSCIAYDMKLRSHCEYYPHNRTCPKGVFEGLRRMLNYAKTDMMTTDSSTSPFAQDELIAILDLVNSLKDDERISDPYSIWLIARLMGYFTENQFLNFCGQRCARLDADTALFGQQTWNRHIAFNVVNVFLFGSPNEHANRLQRVWVDGIIIQPRWKDFINRLTTELSRYTLFSTVMLAVNFSFLAVPGVTIQDHPATSIQIIIYCSIVSTVGSIMFSFVLLNVYSNPGLMDARPAAEAMRTLSLSKSGMAFLAITHSLPISCLVWSIVLFATALAVQIFGPKERATYVTLGVECLILVLSGFMSVVPMWLLSGSDDKDTFAARFMSAVVIRLFSRHEEVNDADTSPDNIASATGTQSDLELGSQK